MTEHTDTQKADILAAAENAGAIDPTDFLVLIPPASALPPAEAVAAIKSSRPEYFKAGVADMNSTEFAAAKRKALRAAESARRAMCLAAFTKVISNKSALDMTPVEWKAAKHRILESGLN